MKFGATHLFRTHISATTPNIAEIERIEAGEGRYFTKVEEESRRNVTFIGADVAEKLFQDRLRSAKRSASTGGHLK